MRWHGGGIQARGRTSFDIVAVMKHLLARPRLESVRLPTRLPTLPRRRRDGFRGGMIDTAVSSLLTWLCQNTCSPTRRCRRRDSCRCAMSDTAKPTRPCRCCGGCRGAAIDTGVSRRLTLLCQREQKHKSLLADMAVSSMLWLPLSMAIDTAASGKCLLTDTAVLSPRWLSQSCD